MTGLKKCRIYTRWNIIQPSNEWHYCPTTWMELKAII
jgi:hypothetical protein